MESPTPEKHILVVDDDVDFLEQQRLHLVAAGYRVTSAGSRCEAEESLEQQIPDLAIVDLMMEETDGGFALCYHLKQKDPGLPVVLVTGVTRETGIEFDATTEEERSWVQADTVLAKPVRFEQLEAEIERLLEERSNGNAATDDRR